MKPLVTNRKVLTWLCILPAETTSNKRMKLVYVAFSFVLIASCFLGFLSSLAFIVKYVTTNLEDCLYALFQVAGDSSVLYMMIVAFNLRHKIAALFDGLTVIYNANWSAGTFKFLARANNQSEQIWPIYVKFLIGGVLLGKVGMCSSTAIFCSMKYDAFNSKCVYKPYKTIVPWNHLTPLGTFWEIIFHIITGETYLILNGTFLLFFASLCLHHRAFYERFRYTVSKWNERSGNRNDKSTFFEIVRFHILVKGFFMESVELYSLFILIQLICSMVFLASAVFQMDLQVQHPTFAASLIWIAFVVAALNLFVYCYFGKSATDSFSGMADCLFEANWFEFSVELQKYFVLAIQNAQRPMFYHGFGIAILNLDTLTNMLKTVFTFYMMFKTITSG